MWCTIYDIFVLRVVNVVTTMVIGVEIKVHDSCHVH